MKHVNVNQTLFPLVFWSRNWIAIVYMTHICIMYFVYICQKYIYQFTFIEKNLRYSFVDPFSQMYLINILKGSRVSKENVRPLFVYFISCFIIPNYLHHNQTKFLNRMKPILFQQFFEIYSFGQITKTKW